MHVRAICVRQKVLTKYANDNSAVSAMNKGKARYKKGDTLKKGISSSFDKIC